MSCLFWNQQRLCSSFMVQLLLHWSQRCGSSSRPHAAGTSFSVPHDSQPNIATLRTRSCPSPPEVRLQDSTNLWNVCAY